MVFDFNVYSGFKLADNSYISVPKGAVPKWYTNFVYFIRTRKSSDIIVILSLIECISRKTIKRDFTGNYPIVIKSCKNSHMLDTQVEAIEKVL